MPVIYHTVHYDDPYIIHLRYFSKSPGCFNPPNPPPKKNWEPESICLLSLKCLLDDGSKLKDKFLSRKGRPNEYQKVFLQNDARSTTHRPITLHLHHDICLKIMPTHHSNMDMGMLLQTQTTKRLPKHLAIIVSTLSYFYPANFT